MTRILVASCQKYSDAWEPFLTLFKRFWPDCPYDLDLLTDTHEKGDCRFERVIETGADLGWSGNLLKALDFYERNYGVNEPVILMLEDYFLSGPVNTEVVKRAVHYAKDRDLGVSCVRLMPCPGPDEPYDSAFGKIHSEAPYRVSAQMAVWNIPALKAILRHTGDPWSFEIRGTQLRLEGLFLSVQREFPFPVSYINSAISRGQWAQGGLDHCKSLGVFVDTSRRPTEGVQG